MRKDAPVDTLGALFLEQMLQKEGEKERLMLVQNIKTIYGKATPF
jgi:hypothetical protein